MPGAGLTIRVATIADAAHIAAIYAEHVHNGTATFDTVPPTAAEIAGKVTHFAERGWPFLVADRDHGIAGYAYAAQFRDRAAYSFACEDSIYIDTAVRGQGIGTELLKALLVAAEAAGFRQMIAVIGGGEPASVALHSHAGFTHAGRMQSVGRKFGQWRDTVYMQRALGEGDSSAPPFEPR